MTYTQKVVKSVGRTLEVLEYFGPDKKSAAISEIAEDLGYPISSTAELLWSMVELGYLSFDTDSRKFRPTIKLSLLGYWVTPAPMGSLPLLSLMEDVARDLDCTVALAAPEKLSVRYLHVVTKQGPSRQKFNRGDGKCMFHSAIGRLALSRHPSSKVSLIVRRINSEIVDTHQVPVSEMLSEIHGIKDKGYSLSVEGVTPNYGCVAIAIPSESYGQELMLGIGAPAERIRADGTDMARELAKRTAGLVGTQISVR